MIKFLYLFTIFFVCCIYSADSLPKFIRGRLFNRNNLQSKLLTNVPDQYFEQRLDHFDESTTDTWQQRYWINDQYFDVKNGPVFIMIGGEGEENPIWIDFKMNTTWVQFAKKYRALCVMLEHRFYGKSHPTNDLSTENLIYLSSEQALADLANFRQFVHLKYNLTDSNRWVSFGGSYPGSLSAWFRLKYPHLVYAAVSSSAPMLALVDFTDYMVVVNNSLSAYSPLCPKNIQAATRAVQTLIRSLEGRQKLQSLFKTCDPIFTNDDITNFFASISGNFEGVVQYNKDNRAFEGATDTNNTIDLLCDIMNDVTLGDPLTRYAKVNEQILKTYKQDCLDSSYKNMISQLQQVNWNQSAAVGGRQWTYQTCVEFGFFQSTSSSSQPFGSTVPIDFYIKQCQDIFGSKFSLDLLNDSIYNTNINYGGYDYEGSRVVFVNGNVDPWHALGFTAKAPNTGTETVFIPGTAHCADMYPANDNDPIALTLARAQIDYLISKWLIN